MNFPHRSSLRHLVLLVLLISPLADAAADAIPFPVETRYEHWLSDYYQSPTYQVSVWSFHQRSEPGKTKEGSESMNFDEYWTRYGNFRYETTWWDGGGSLAQTWMDNNLIYSGSANTDPISLDAQVSSYSFSTGVETASGSHFSEATLFIGNANGGSWQPPSQPPTQADGDPQPLVIWAAAAELASGNVIPKSSISVNGKSLGTDGYAVFSAAPNANINLQVSVAGGNNYAFSASGETHPPRIMAGTDDISKETTTVWAGQIVSLECRLAPGINGTPPVESYSWEVGGDAVKNVQLVNTNGFFKIPLTDKTNSIVTFAWLGATPSPAVTVKVKVKGLEFTQKAFFQVRKPQVTMLAHKNGIIAGSPTELSPASIQLWKPSAGFNENLNGYLATSAPQSEGVGSDQFQFFQKITKSLRIPVDSTGAVILSGYRDFENKHDRMPPYPSPIRFLPPAHGSVYPNGGSMMVDSPSEGLALADRVTVWDRFETWLMFKAPGGTFVPIGKNQWYWRFDFQCSPLGVGYGQFLANDWDASGFETTNELPTWNGIHDEN